MKATARAHPNIAFIKYWGKADEKLRLPLNSSISMNLDGAETVTTVEFDMNRKKDEVIFLNQKFSEKEILRVIRHLDLIRNRTKTFYKAKVVTKNNFPTSGGVASSASGFAALTVAACKAAGVGFGEKEITILARLGSGSACRSIPDGFVEWKRGANSDSSYSYSIYDSKYWNLGDVIAVVETRGKKVPSTEGHSLVNSSPFMKARLKGLAERIERVKESLRNKDFRKMGEAIEEEAISMHVVAMTSKPAIFYWNEGTLQIIQALLEWREKGIYGYFTIDAGPNVHIICQKKDMNLIALKVKKLSSVIGVIKNGVGKGTVLSEKHLF